MIATLRKSVTLESENKGAFSDGKDICHQHPVAVDHWRSLTKHSPRRFAQQGAAVSHLLARGIQKVLASGSEGVELSPTLVMSPFMNAYLPPITYVV